jgi:hypothetical protein
MTLYVSGMICTAASPPKNDDDTLRGVIRTSKIPSGKNLQTVKVTGEGPRRTGDQERTPKG